MPALVQPGDSGGPVYSDGSGRYAVGTVSAVALDGEGATDCPDWAPNADCRFWFFAGEVDGAFSSHKLIFKP